MIVVIVDTVVLVTAETMSTAGDGDAGWLTGVVHGFGCCGCGVTDGPGGAGDGVVGGCTERGDSGGGSESSSSMVPIPCA